MRLYVTSDLHLEFGDLTIENKDQVDVLILSGDICVAADIGRPDGDGLQEGQRSRRIRDFFRRCSRDFPHVIMVMGNHEHYHGDFSKSQAQIQAMLDADSITNIRLLEKSTCEIDGYLFIGGTLWTDFNGADPLTMNHAQFSMNDYRGVKHSAKGHAGGIWRFVPQDTLHDHRAMLSHIRVVIDDRRAQGITTPRVVVVGHHSPSRASTHPRYQHDHHVNGCYSTNLDEFIQDRPEIVLWTHGHTHHEFDYNIGATRVVCNPRGYVGYESRADAFQPKLIEL